MLTKCQALFSILSMYNSFSREKTLLIKILSLHCLQLRNGGLIKKKEIMPLAATWMDLEMIILSEVSQIEKDKHPRILLIYGI